MSMTNRMTWWTSPSAWRGAAILILVLAAASCSEDAMEPPTVGSIQVDVATTGSDVDPDGYTVLVDGGSGMSVGANGSVTFSDLSQGNHEVTLDGVASNCSVTGSNPRTVSVTAGQVSQVTMAVSCSEIPGDLVITTTTSGTDQDTGYQYSVDGGAATAIGANASDTIQLAPGSHSVVLSDVAANCSVTGGTTQNPTVVAGGVVNADFVVTCAEILGDLVITTTTSGSDQDTGYQYSVDGGAATAIGANASDTIQLAPGSHSVVLSDVAANCSVTGGATQTPTVVGGGVVNADFAVTCLTQLSNQIVFDSDRNAGNWDIYVMDPNGGNVQRLTTRAAADREPYVTQDGTRIAFVSDERGGNEDIWVMNTDGTGLTNLTPTSADADNNPAWSPDGTKIAFSRRPSGGARNIWVMDADGGNLVQLTFLGGTATASLPSWSPGGDKIVYQSDAADGDGDAEIVVMTTDGSAPGAVQQLTFNTVPDFAAAFSPDGTQIAFTSERDGDREVYVMTDTGGSPTNITNDASFDDLAPAWSPDGSQIAFASNKSGNNDVHIINSDGSGVATNITNNAANDFEASWAP